jgi:predicted phosphodiesterase
MECKLKTAILADMHGNSIALNKVLDDIQSIGGVDEYWFLGDYAAIGHDPVGVLERISNLPNALFIRGNTDRYICTGELPWPRFTDMEKEPALAPLHIHIVRSFSWTMGAVSAMGWLSWFKNLPLDVRFTLPDGSKVLAVHAAPGTDDGTGISFNISDDDLLELVSDVEADLVLVGHTHLPLDRTVGNIRVINPGSISNPFPPDLRASYAILEADENGYEINHRRVDYDREAVIKAVQKVNHPASEYITRFMKGENKKDWMK